MRHQLGTQASSGRYPLSTRDLLTSFEMVIKWASKQEGLGASQLKALSDVIAEVRLLRNIKFVAITCHSEIQSAYHRKFLSVCPFVVNSVFKNSLFPRRLRPKDFP